MAALVDTNLLVYVHDPRLPAKQRRATEILVEGLKADTIRVAHQAIVEFVAAVTRPSASGQPLMPAADARREAEELLAVFVVLYPADSVVRTALRGAAMYGLSWFDAHMWAYAEVYGLSELWSRTSSTTGCMAPFARSTRSSERSVGPHSGIDGSKAVAARATALLNGRRREEPR